jgi:hypothetical protein
MTGRNRQTLIRGLLALLLVAGLAGFSAAGRWYADWLREFGPGWHEMAWPFPPDLFPPGRAWRNGDTRVYVRPKLDLCLNAERGVADDAELDRVSDIGLLDAAFVPLNEGARVRITDLSGRARLYRLRDRDGQPVLAEALAVSLDCDLVVAAIVGKVDDPAVRREAHLFLESNTVQVWLNRILERR